MTRFLTPLAALLALATGLRADLTLEQTIEGGPQPGPMLLRVKGDRFRIDLPAGPSGRMSTIVDAKTGDTITLVHDKKIAITRSGAQIREAADAKPKPPGDAAEPPKPVATGRGERVGVLDTDLYTFTVDGSEETLWVAKDFPGFDAIKADLARIASASAGGASRAATLDLTALPGMVVQRRKARGGQTMTIILLKAAQDPLADAVFQIPPDYKAVVPPTHPE